MTVRQYVTWVTSRLRKNTSICWSSFPRTPSSYHLSVWKQESFLVRIGFQTIFRTIIIWGYESARSRNHSGVVIGEPPGGNLSVRGVERRPQTAPPLATSTRTAMITYGAASRDVLSRVMLVGFFEAALRVPRSSRSHCGGVVFFFDFAHLAWAARRACALRSSAVWFFTRFLPPLLPILARYSLTLSTRRV